MNKPRITLVSAWFIQALAVGQPNSALNGTATPVKTTTLRSDDQRVQTFASIELIPLPYDQIRIFNDNTAVITAHYKVVGNDHGKDFTMQTRSLATWVKRNGSWQMVAFQATGVAKPFQK